jgi:hypothetical protein
MTWPKPAAPANRQCNLADGNKAIVKRKAFIEIQTSSIVHRQSSVIRLMSVFNQQSLIANRKSPA